MEKYEEVGNSRFPRQQYHRRLIPSLFDTSAQQLLYVGQRYCPLHQHHIQAPSTFPGASLLNCFDYLSKET
jgi:hypothetical protein